MCCLCSFSCGWLTIVSLHTRKHDKKTHYFLCEQFFVFHLVMFWDFTDFPSALVLRHPIWFLADSLALHLGHKQ